MNSKRLAKQPRRVYYEFTKELFFSLHGLLIIYCWKTFTITYYFVSIGARQFMFLLFLVLFFF